MPKGQEAVNFDGLLPAAVSWVVELEGRVLREGAPLGVESLGHARALGIRQAERVRVLVVERMPRPADPALGGACDELGILKGYGGLCVGYGICIAGRDVSDLELIAHELVHTQQYERMGGAALFLRAYLEQLLLVGYHDAPLEVEARKRGAEVCRGGRA